MSETLSTVPFIGDSTVVLNHFMSGLFSARISPFFTWSPGFFSRKDGISPAVTERRLAILTGKTLPGSSVCATMSVEATFCPSAARTMPGMGSTRRLRSTVQGMTLSPGVYA